MLPIITLVKPCKNKSTDKVQTTVVKMLFKEKKTNKND